MALKVIRARSTSVLKLVEPNLTFLDERLKLPFLEELAIRLTQSPDSVFVLVGLDDNEETKAFLIAYNPGPKVPYAALAQVWSHPENSWDWYIPFLTRLIFWSVSLDKDHIRAETGRDTEALYRRFGFKSAARIVSFDLVQTGFQDLLVNNPEEFFKWATSSAPT